MGSSDKFRNAKTFSVYYGKGCPDKLAAFDIAVIEPMAQEISCVRNLQEKGVAVFAYLSVMEVRPDQKEFDLHFQDLLKIEGEFVLNHEFETYYTDLRSEEWKRHLYEKAEAYLNDYGCDGLFLDTIGNLEDPRIPTNMKYIFIEETVALLEKIKKDHPESMILQNNGLGLLLQYTKTYIDGICWENICFKRGMVGKINKVIIKRLREFQEEVQLRVLLLTEESGQHRKIAKFAGRNGFLYYDAPKDYMRL